MVKTATLPLPEFLLARIADDEAAWSGGLGLVTRPDFSKLSRHMLAECEAKRRIVARAVAARSFADRAREMGWPHEVHQAAAVAYEDATLMLALPYADHPAFRPEWRD